MSQILLQNNEFFFLKKGFTFEKINNSLQFPITKHIEQYKLKHAQMTKTRIVDTFSARIEYLKNFI